MDKQTISKNELESYQAICSFLAWALYSDFDEAAFAAFASQADSFAEEPFSSIASDEGLLLRDVFAQAGADSEKAWQCAHRDRSYLFYMIGASHTSPYESVYRTDDATLFGPTTLEVRNAYRECGLEHADSQTSPDDHIGLEMSFAAELLGRAARGDDSAIDSLRNFLSQHLLVFSGVYFDNLRTQAQSDFYRAVAGLGKKTMELLSAVFGVTAAESIKTNPLAI